MIELHQGNCLNVLKTLEPESVNCCITSPPYFGLRDYGVDGQLGLEETPGEYVENLVEVFREVFRVLKPDGTLWLNLGSSYAGSRKGMDKNGKHHGSLKQKSNKGSILPVLNDKQPILYFKSKDMIPIPWMVAEALRSDGWYLRQDLIWSKTNPMPESVKDRCTKSHEYIFLLSKSPKYYYDYEAVKEPSVCGDNGSRFDTGKTGINKDRNWKKRPSAKKGSFNGKTEQMADTGQNAFRAVTDTRNKRSVWTVSTKPYKEAHFATFPPDLIKPCVLAGCHEKGTILDPFSGAGTTGVVAKENNRNYIGIELNPEYLEMSRKRIEKATYQMGF